MKTRRSWFAKFATALLLMLFAAAWVAFAPIQFGGQAAFVIVNGNSMEPLYHRGDLVIIRAQSDYQVGDIVTYRHPQIGPVIHRIIERDVDHFVFKGDHNNFIDPYQPVRAELIGKSWIYLPYVGNILTQLRTPLHMAILAAVAGVVIMAPSINIGQQPTVRKRNRQAGSPTAQHKRGSIAEGLLMALAVLGCAAIALIAFAFTRPISHDVPSEITYQQTGAFDYSATAPAGLYDSNTIQTGDPLFPQLTSDATFTFNYKLAADALADLHGSYRLVAELGTSNGWQRTIEIQPTTTFSGGACLVTGVLHFDQVRALIDHFEQQTGLEHQQYKLAIVPELDIEGTLNQRTFQDKFAPRLEFRLDETQMQLQETSSTDKDPLKPSKPGLIKYTHVEPNVIQILFLKLEISLAQEIGAAGLGVALAGLIVLGLLRLHAGRPDEAMRIGSKYGTLLIDVAGSNPLSSQPVVTVSAIEDLAKLAEKSGQMILHELSGPTHRYCVHDDGICYCYQLTIVTHDEPPTPPPLSRVVGVVPSAAWHAIFLDTLREKGTVAEACRVANIEIATAYQERIRVPAFAQAWTEARAALREALSRESELR